MEADRLILGDAREVIREFPDGCFALAVIDGPYNLRKAEWDKFPSWEAFVDFYRPLMAELARVLRDNSSFYLFGTFEGLAALKPMLDGMDGFRLLNHICWVNPPMLSKFNRAQFRSWLPAHREQAVLYVRESHDISEEAREEVMRPDNGLRHYLNAERRRAGLSVSDCIAVCGSTARHYFGRSQWRIPTRAHYEELRRLFNERGNGRGEHLRRDYEDLRREYEYLRVEYEDLRYPFNPQKGMTDVWNFGICQGNERLKENGKTAHVAQKPLAMMEAIVRASSNEGDVIIDPFCGSGTVPVACQKLGRRFVAIDANPKWIVVTERRLADTRRRTNLTLPLEPDRGS